MSPGRVRGAWWLSRALYRCKAIPLGHVRAGERRAVLRNLLLAWAPFDEPEYHVVLRGTVALAFAWDAVLVRGLLAGAGAPAKAVLWPESLLREPMGSDGLRVLQCLEGVEAQAWHGQALLATRWWPEPPDPNEAVLWLRSLGPESGGVEALPATAQAPWRGRPWAELQSVDELRSTSSRLERVVVGSALVGFAALTAAQAHQALVAHQQRESLQSELQRLQLEAAPVLAARERALAMAGELQTLATQMTGVLPLELLQYLADVLPARGVMLRELELNGSKLHVALELAPDVQRSALVKDLQTGGWLTKLTEARDTTGRGWVAFDAELAGSRAPAVAPRPQANAATPDVAPAPAAPAFPFPTASQPAPSAKAALAPAASARVPATRTPSTRRTDPRAAPAAPDVADATGSADAAPADAAPAKQRRSSRRAASSP